jgi:hypothetical protein
MGTGLLRIYKRLMLLPSSLSTRWLSFSRDAKIFCCVAKISVSTCVCHRPAHARRGQSLIHARAGESDKSNQREAGPAAWSGRGEAAGSDDWLTTCDIMTACGCSLRRRARRAATAWRQRRWIRLAAQIDPENEAS